MKIFDQCFSLNIYSKCSPRELNENRETMTKLSEILISTWKLKNRKVIVIRRIIKFTIFLHNYSLIALLIISSEAAAWKLFSWNLICSETFSHSRLERESELHRNFAIKKAQIPTITPKVVCLKVSAPKNKISRSKCNIFMKSFAFLPSEQNF